MKYNNFSSIYSKLDAIKSAGVPDPRKHNDQLLTEAVIYDMLKSDDKVKQFLTEAAAYLKESELLSESAIQPEANEVVSLDSMTENRSRFMSVLVSAKEAEDSDFKLFEKSLMLMFQAFNAMETKYGGHAEDRIQSIQESILSDKRVATLLNSAK